MKRINNDLITVIINVFNCEKYIKKCLDSIVSQTYKNLEILIINDGSTDNTLEICKSVNDKRIKIVSTENYGLGISRNIGIENALGKYLYFVDADDFIEVDAIEYLYKLIIESNAQISTCAHLVVYNYNIPPMHFSENVQILNNYDFLKLALMRKNNTMSIWNKLIRKDLFQNLRFSGGIVNDIEFTHKLIFQADNIIISSAVKYFYFKNKNSVCEVKYNDYNRMIQTYDAYLERYRYIEKLHPMMLENTYVMLEFITRIYLRTNKNILKYLKKNKVKKLYRQMFTLKIFKLKIKFRKKIALIIFYFSSSFYKAMYVVYSKLFMKKLEY